MKNWINNSIFYHIYPLGFCGAPKTNEYREPVNRIQKIADSISHFKEMHVNAIYLGPIFESSTHGYDTTDYREIDSRLGTNDDFKKVTEELHKNGIKVILDGVFNHVGRDFWAFKDVKNNLSNSKYAYWFNGMNFNGHSEYGDPFWYEGWQGYYSLVKLNVKNDEVSDYLLDTVKFWIDEFSIDGLRLDAADCVDDSFWKKLNSFTKSINPDFWLMGEIIHGDYNRWANSGMLDSVTNYECYKGIYSSHNDKNYFEIAYSLNRQFGDQKLYKNLLLYNFVDNHDVNRLTSMLKNQNHVYNVYTLLYTMPGVPSVYYGSEYGIKGEKQNNSDDNIRPEIDYNSLPDKNEKLYSHICRLGYIRTHCDLLKYGEYQQITVKNEQFIYRRFYENKSVYIILNLSDKIEVLTFKSEYNKLTDLLSNKKFSATENGFTINAEPFSSMILSNETIDIETANTSEPKESNIPVTTKVVIGADYRHYKGHIYKVIAIARHSETLEDMVVYQDENSTWVRPLSMFCENVEIDGKVINRFKIIQ